MEGLLARVLFGAVILYSLRRLLNFVGEDHPVGLLEMVQPMGWSLMWLTEPAAFEVFRMVLVGVVALYVIGLGLPIVLPVLALMHILYFTFYNSQGFSHHGNQIVSLTLMFQACCAVVAAFKSRSAWGFPDARLRAWILVQSQVVIVGCYFISVMTKMEKSDGEWFQNSNYIAVDMVKTSRQGYLNHLDPSHLERQKQAEWYLERPNLSRLLFSSGVLLEAVSILAIGHRLLGFVIGVSLVLMHRSISALMGLDFPYYEMLDVIYLVGLPFGLAWLISKLPGRATQWGLLAGAAAGIPLSYLFQEPKMHAYFPFPGYVVDAVQAVGAWESWDSELYVPFVIPLLTTMSIMAVVGVGVGLLFQRFVKNAVSSQS